MNKVKVVEDPDSESGLSFQFPEEVFDELGWKVGDELSLVMNENGEIIISKVFPVHKE